MYLEIPIGRIEPNPKQPRQVFDEEALAELVHSVREFGLMQPVVVRRLEGDRFQLVMGERRPPHFTEPKPPRFDQWDAKGIAERLIQVALPGAKAAFVPASVDAQARGELWAIHVNDTPT